MPPENDDLSQRQIWGAALRALRIRVGKTLHEAVSASLRRGEIVAGR
jgi:hypothetical protein